MIEVRSKIITLSLEDLQEYFPALAMMLNSSMLKKKRSYRKRKKKETIGPMIQEIIDSIE